MVSFKLKDIGTNPDILKIPNLQRGLVWNARRVELLWDSILRGFPIGVFTVYQSNNGDPFDLIDGQQRRYAIMSAYAYEAEEKNPQSMIWIDLEAASDPVRKYCIRVTNKAHPWGYHLDGTALSTEERRKAIDEAGYNCQKFNKTECSILDFIPYGSICPIPFSFLLKSNNKEEVIKCCKEFAKTASKWGDKFQEEIDGRIASRVDGLLKDIKILDKYEIGALVIDSPLDIEILFERIGKGGKEISNKELSYAVIKHCWPKKIDFAEVYHSISADGLKVLPEVDFAMIIFRLFLSNKENIKDEISVNDIRAFIASSGEDSLKRKDRIAFAYENDGAQIKHLVKRVDEWLLGEKHNHYIIRSEIARKNDKLYVFLLWLALLEVESKLQFIRNGDFVRALAFYLHVCASKGGPRSLDRYKKYSVEYLYKNLNRALDRLSGTQMSESEFRLEVGKYIKELIVLGWCIMPTDSLDGFRALNDNVTEARELGQFKREPYFALFERLFPYQGNDVGLFVLKLYQSDYYRLIFPDYDPSQSDLWKDTNRPWDHDHIIPQKWGDNPGDYTRFVQFYINSIGNIADIPYELNRSKGDKPEWDHYEKQKDLLFGQESQALFDLFKADDQFRDRITKTSLAAKLFSCFAAQRFDEITSPFLSLITSQLLHGPMPGIIKTRREVFLKLQGEYLRDFTLFYLASDDGYEKEFTSDNEYGWMQTWISLGRRCGDTKQMHSITIGIESSGCCPYYIVECGKRKWAETSLADAVDGRWWQNKCYVKFDGLRQDSQIDIVSKEIFNLFRQKYLNGVPQ